VKKLAAIVIGVLIAGLLCECGPLNRQVETVQFPSPKGWPKGGKWAKHIEMIGSDVWAFEEKRELAVLASRPSPTFTPPAYITLIVYEGESIDNWTEALEIIHTSKDNSPPTPEKAYNMQIEERINRCPEAKANVISQDNNSILYESFNCLSHPDENSLIRILYGNSDVFNLIYTNKVRTLSEETRNDWIRVLSEANIKTLK